LTPFAETWRPKEVEFQIRFGGNPSKAATAILATSLA
jgi:hypothetical protein